MLLQLKNKIKSKCLTKFLYKIPENSPDFFSTGPARIQLNYMVV